MYKIDIINKSKLELELVWEPKWTRDFITPNGKKKQLGIVLNLI